MVYKIPAPRKGHFFRFILRFYLIRAIIAALIIGVFVYCCEDDVVVQTVMVVSVFLTVLAVGFFRVRGEVRYVANLGTLVMEACTLTVSEAGVLVESPVVSKFIPWGALQKVICYGKTLIFQRDGASTCYIAVSDVPAGQVAAIIASADAYLGVEADDDLDKLSMAELRHRAVTRLNTPPPAPAEPEPKPEAPAAEPVPAPFVKGEAIFPFSATPEQVEEVALYYASLQKRSALAVKWIMALLMCVFLLFACDSAAQAKPGQALFLLVFALVFLLRRLGVRQRRVPVAGKRRVQWACGQLVCEDAKGAWVSLDVPDQELATARLPHTLYVYGKKSCTGYMLADADSTLPRWLPAPVDVPAPRLPKRWPYWALAALCLAGTLAWQIGCSEHYRLFRAAVESEKPGAVYCSPETIRFARTLIPVEEEGAATDVSAQFTPGCCHYKLTYTYTRPGADWFYYGTVWYLPTGHAFYNSGDFYEAEPPSSEEWDDEEEEEEP